MSGSTGALLRRKAMRLRNWRPITDRWPAAFVALVAAALSATAYAAAQPPPETAPRVATLRPPSSAVATSVSRKQACKTAELAANAARQQLQMRIAQMARCVAREDFQEDCSGTAGQVRLEHQNVTEAVAAIQQICFNE